MLASHSFYCRAVVCVFFAAGLALACNDDDSPPTPGTQEAGASGVAKAGSSAADSGKGGSAPAAGSRSEAPSEPRAQDSRTFNIDAASVATGFDALAGLETDRFSGVLDGSGYRIEIPKADWNGILVMYAHGYAGTGEALRVTTPSIRQHLIEQGYAWAASSYSKNYYDVRAGVEDTNKLALAFKKIAADNGRMLEEPKKRYIIGHSMGGHITGAAIEKEAAATAANKVRYAGAVPMCGVMGDTALFNYFTAFQFAAQKLANVPYTTMPVADFMPIRMMMRDALFTKYPTELTPAGEKLKVIVANLTGGARPYFSEGFRSMQWQDAVWGTFGGDGKISGVLSLPVTDTREIVYQLDSDPELSAEEKAFNDEIYRAEPHPDANPIRTDGVRWIPVVNGEFDIPVVSLHTLGDLYVPFKMQQVYRERAEAKGNGERLVQRAIRGTGHCEFSLAEQIDAFDAMVRWEQDGQKPEGDDVMDAKKLAAPDYGCKFTQNRFSPAEMSTGTLPAVRMAAPACP